MVVNEARPREDRGDGGGISQPAAAAAAAVVVTAAAIAGKNRFYIKASSWVCHNRLFARLCLYSIFPLKFARSTTMSSISEVLALGSATPLTMIEKR